MSISISFGGALTKRERFLGRGRVFVLVLVLVLLSLAPFAGAGGPRYVAGVSFFNAGTKGTPLTWAQGAVHYYTDQGDLSPVLPGASADAFVAAAFARWTSTSTAAVLATRIGQLEEDVSGSNVVVNSDGTITVPADILPGNTAQPVAIVYDADGSVTDALLGQSAGDASQCAENSVLGGVDNLTADAHLSHALVILNGNCAQTSGQLPDLNYHLVRTLGQVLGLDWSQVNVNVVTGQPSRATAADYAGFPVMHALDSPLCVSVSSCYPGAADPAQPKMDDQAALSRLYPVTAQNQSSFPGKQVFAETTARIHGTVYFADTNGQRAQPMQGVNVVGRWVDPSTGVASRTYAAASVSGFLFRGNAGNPITGFDDINGEPYDRLGSNDATVEGSFDLAGLVIPDSETLPTFELTVEAVDPVWSVGIQPYGSWQVQPSGIARVFVNVPVGQDIQQDIVMQAGAVGSPSLFGQTSYSAPVSLPSGGDWVGSLSPYGDVEYFQFPAQTNRTLSVAVTALNETGTSSINKAQPVIGMWALGSGQTSPAPAQTTSAFNTAISGETRLDAVINANTSFTLAVGDFRGDGRPDFRYHAHVFYGDNVSPVRASAGGGTALAIRGLGFRAGDGLNVAGVNLTPLAISAKQLLVIAPKVADSVQTIALTDPASGGSSVMTQALTFGAGPEDAIKLVAGASQTAPVGGQAPMPVTVQVLTPDGITPVGGASVVFTSSPPVSLSACGGASSCTVFSNESGLASSWVPVLTPTVSTITVLLAPASYNPPQQVAAVVVGMSSSLDIALSPQAAWIAQGATAGVPLTARVLSGGTPVAGRTVNYQIFKGAGLLSSASAVSDANGFATSTLQLSSMVSDILVSACVQNQPVDSPCLSFTGTAVPLANLQLHPVAGRQQIAPVGQKFLPFTVQVTDSAASPHPVLGAGVVFELIVARSPQNQPVVWIGDTGITGNPMPVILSSSQTAVSSDANGMAGLLPSTGGALEPVLVLGTAAAGSATVPFELQWLSPLAPSAGSSAVAPSVSNLRRVEAAR